MISHRAEAGLLPGAVAGVKVAPLIVAASSVANSLPVAAILAICNRAALPCRRMGWPMRKHRGRPDEAGAAIRNHGDALVRFHELKKHQGLPIPTHLWD